MEKVDLTAMEQRFKIGIPPGHKALLGLCWLILMLLAGVSAQYQAKQQQKQRLLGESQRLQRSIQHELDRFRNFPKVLAFQQQIVEPLRLNLSLQRRQQLNLYLQEINQRQGSDVSYLLDINGTTIASSNWQSPRSFVGSNYSYRPYFQTAILGKYGQYFALGLHSGIRGYYFSAPVFDEQKVIGVVVVKVALNIIERSWRDPHFEYLLTDKHGVVFYASQNHWLYHSIRPMAESLRQQIINSRQYGEHQLANIAQRKNNDGIALPNYRGDLNNYISIHRVLPTAGWHLYALSPQSSYSSELSEALLLCSLLYWGLVLLYLYWRQLQTSRQLQAQANQLLEGRVQQRTAELTRANRQLQQALDDDHRTAQTLKKLKKNWCRRLN
jgi:two-component system C4-dicarboxylate transport sensor histidine kinase DctB